MIVLFCLILLVLILAIVGLFLKNSPVMTSAICVSFFLMIVFWIVCLIHLIIATPTGKICDIINGRQIVTVLQAFAPSAYDSLNNQFSGNTSLVNSTSNSTFNLQNPLNGQTLDQVVNTVYDALDNCRSGGNLITFFNLTNDLNLRPYITQAINGLNINSTIDSINIGNFGSMDYTGSVNFTSLIGDLQSTFNDYISLINLVNNTSVNDTVRQLNTANTAIQTLATNITLIDICLETNSSVSQAQVNQINSILTGQLNNTSNLIANITGTTIPSILQTLQILRAELDYFNSSAVNLTDTVQALLNYLDIITNELNQTITDIKNELKTTTQNQVINDLYNLSDNVQNRVVALGDCQFLGDDIFAMINSVCINTVGGLDAIWYTCGYLGLMLIIAVVGIALYAKRWIRADTMDQEFGDNYYKGQDYELPPMYSGGNTIK